MILRSIIDGDRRGAIFLALLAIAAVWVPVCHLLFPPSSVFHISTSSVALWGKYLCFAILALSLDLIWRIKYMPIA